MGTGIVGNDRVELSQSDVCFLLDRVISFLAESSALGVDPARLVPYQGLKSRLLAALSCQAARQARSRDVSGPGPAPGRSGAAQSSLGGSRLARPSPAGGRS